MRYLRIAAALVAGTLGVADAILMESAVSFLGLGVGSDLPSWGRLVADGRGELATWWWISTFPGCAIIATVFALNRWSERLQRRAAATPSSP